MFIDSTRAQHYDRAFYSPEHPTNAWLDWDLGDIGADKHLPLVVPELFSSETTSNFQLREASTIRKWFLWKSQHVYSLACLGGTHQTDVQTVTRSPSQCRHMGCLCRSGKTPTIYLTIGESSRSGLTPPLLVPVQISFQPDFSGFLIEESYFTICVGPNGISSALKLSVLRSFVIHQTRCSKKQQSLNLCSWWGANWLLAW